MNVNVKNHFKVFLEWDRIDPARQAQPWTIPPQILGQPALWEVCQVIWGRIWCRKPSLPSTHVHSKFWLTEISIGEKITVVSVRSISTTKLTHLSGWVWVFEWLDECLTDQSCPVCGRKTLADVVHRTTWESNTQTTVHASVRNVANYPRGISFWRNKVNKTISPHVLGQPVLWEVCQAIWGRIWCCKPFSLSTHITRPKVQTLWLMA